MHTFVLHCSTALHHGDLSTYTNPVQRVLLCLSFYIQFYLQIAHEAIRINTYLKFYELPYLMLPQQWLSLPGCMPSRFVNGYRQFEGTQINQAVKEETLFLDYCTNRRQHYLPRITGNFFTIDTV